METATAHRSKNTAEARARRPYASVRSSKPRSPSSQTLGLVTFFTAAEKEARARTLNEGSTVRQAAGRIHNDMERGFIAAEVGDWQDIVAAGSWAKAKEEAKVRLEGRDYVVKDGDTILVRFNV